MTTTWSLSRQQVRELDRRAIEEYGVPGIVLMENAGRGCAQWLRELNPERLPTLVLCGPGNNGGDGCVIARHLDNHGWPVRVWLVGAPDRLPADAATQWAIVQRCGLVAPPPEQFRGWIVDALFGTGLTRPLGPPYADLINMVNRSGNPVLAVDIPSGLDCDSGQPCGPTIRAHYTATFVARKRGFDNPQAAAWIGQVRVIDIGAPRCLLEQYRPTS
jgi:NAD(P)H-hydrate epimerase